MSLQDMWIKSEDMWIKSDFECAYYQSISLQISLKDTLPYFLQNFAEGDID